MFCTKCGAQLPDGSAFCTACGAQLGASAAPAAEPAPAANAAPQQPQYQQPQYQQPQYAAAPQYAPPRQPMDRTKLFGIIVAALFGLIAIFALVAMIGFCASNAMPGHAGVVVTYILIVFGAAGIAVAPFVPKFTKFIILASGVVLAFGYYGISMIMMNQSFGCFVVILGVLAFAFMCWLGYANNNLLRFFWFVPTALIFIGALINWIVMKYFSQGMKFATVFYLFDFLTTIFFLAGAVLLGFYLVFKLGEKSFSFKFPNPTPAPRPQQPQQPQQPQY